MDKRQEFRDKWLAQAKELMGERERGAIRQFFGASPYGAPTEEEQSLRRNAVRVMDTKNWIVDDSGTLHSMDEIAYQALKVKLGLAPPQKTYTGPSISAISPAEAEESFGRYQQRQKDLESQEAYTAFRERSMVQINATYKADWDLIERVRQRQAAEDAHRRKTMSPHERGVLFVLEMVIWELAGGAVGDFVGAATMVRPGLAEMGQSVLTKSRAAVQKAMVQGFESEVGRTI